MKIGVKTYGEKDIHEYLDNKVDFFEVMAVQGRNYSCLTGFSVPIIIHAEHRGFGANPADISRREQDIKSLNFARKIADYVNANKIIVHPGVIEKGNKNCNLENAVNFFKEINDGRILIENLPFHKNEISLCQITDEIKYFIQETNMLFCFDINHAIASFGQINGDFNFIEKYLELNPAHYHIGGQNLKTMEDHLHLFDSNLPLEKILKYYPFDAEITLETGVDAKKVEKDVEIIKGVLRELDYFK